MSALPPKPTNIPADQAWFWREPWATMEREVDELIARGEIRVFESAAAFEDWLAAQAEKHDQIGNVTDREEKS